MPSEYADRGPKPTAPPRLPIQLIGIAGFLLGMAASLVWMIGREPLAPYTEPAAPAVSVAPQPPGPAPNPAKERPSPPAPRPEPEAARAAPVLAPPRLVPVPQTPPAVGGRVPVSINATPWAVISIDGREVGETPLAGIELDAGRHTFQARMPDGSTREQVVEVSAPRAAVVFR
jgi:eukaryotic-like serine/threonine-protein kinase